MNIQELINEFKSLKIIISINKDKIDIEAPKGVLNSEILKKISKNKKNLIKYWNCKNKIELFKGIPSSKYKEYYVLSSAQKRLFFLWQMDPDSIVYNMPAIFKFEGVLNIVKFEQIFNNIMKRHESLRTSFHLKDEAPVQKIEESINYKIAYHDISKRVNGEQRLINTEKGIVKDFIKPFNLSISPLLRVGLIKITSNSYVFMFDMHHIISDGISMTNLVHEFTRMYSNQKLPKLKIQYKDYAEWQQSEAQQKAKNNQKTYWLSQYSDEFPILNLPTDRVRPLTQTFNGADIEFELDLEITKFIYLLSKNNKTTLFMTLFSCFIVLLSRLCNQNDIIIGVPIAGRRHSDLDDVIGMFVGTLALRNKVDSNTSFINYLNKIKENTLLAFENQDYQFEDLVDQVVKNRDLSRNPLFDVMFNLLNTKDNELTFKDLILKPYLHSNDTERITSKFDLTLSCVESKGKLYFRFEYNRDLFDKFTIKRFIGYFKAIINSVIEDPKQDLAKINILSSSEREQLLYEFNDSVAVYPKDKTIHQLFEEQVKRTPDNISLVFEDSVMSYQELNARSNQLARLLRDKGVATDTIVGIMGDRSFEMIIGILGIIKSAGAYLPIDPTHPADRISYILEDAGVSILLTQGVHCKKMDFSDILQIVYLDNCDNIKNSGLNLEVINKSTDLAYVIYTSGSTGKPKGVMIEHRSVVNLCSWHTSYFEINKKDIVTLYASFGFDASIWELFPYLMNGSSLHIISSELRLDIDKVNNYFQNKNVTISFLPTHLCEQFMKYKNNQLRYLLTGGDKLKYYDTTNYAVVNNYGPTENTVVASCFILDKHYNTIPIGKPIDNIKLYITNELNNNIQPIGVSGELCIAGAGLSRGYLNNKALTAEKFIDNPFGEGRLYKTGDLSRWLSDGNIEFLGRLDHQVKIRGFRIELGEIENQLLSIEKVSEVAVVDKVDRNNDKYLCAYIVYREEAKLKGLGEEINDIRLFLSNSLPNYMIPSHFVEVKKLPLMSSGKIDRKALPEPEIIVGEDYVAPSNDLEKILTSIWSEVLNIEKDKISVNANFFDIGGNSLKASKMISKIQKIIKVQIPIIDVFKYQSIEGLSSFITKQHKGNYFSVPVSEKKEYYSLSYTQKIIYTAQQVDLENIAYNIPGKYYLKISISKNMVESIFKKLINRHEILRTSFTLINGKVVQKIYDFEEIKFKIEYFQILDISNERKIHEVYSNFIKSFDLTKVPLIRVGFIENINSKSSVLLVDMHHIVSDATSHAILTQDFTKLFNFEQLPEIRLQYCDYSEWLNNNEQQNKLEKQEKYWLDELKDEAPVLNLSTDYLRPEILNNEGNSVDFMINEKDTKCLKQIAKETESTLFMILLSIYYILLHKYSSQDDIIVGVPVANRRHLDLQNVVGVFINTLILRNYPEEQKTFLELLNEVKVSTLKAFENQEYKFETLLDKVKTNRKINRNAIFDVMFNLLNHDNSEYAYNNLIYHKSKNYSHKKSSSKYDLSLRAFEIEKKINFTIEYKTKLFKTVSIDRMIELFKTLILQIIKNQNVKISNIETLSENYKSQILTKFNQDLIVEKVHTIQDKILKSFEKYSQNIAIKCKENEYTYNQLNTKTAEIAKYLNRLGVKSGSHIGIMISDKIDFISVLIGVLRARCVFIPLDQTLPVNRLIAMVEITDIDLILSDNENKVWMNSLQNDVFNSLQIQSIDKISIEESKNIEQLPAQSYNGEDSIYIYFTSGSSGVPKPIIGVNKGLSQFIEWEIKTFEVNENFIFSQFASIGFDAFLRNVLTPLCVGAKVCIPSNKELMLDSDKLINWINNNKITFIHCVPSVFRIINSGDLSHNNFKHLKFILLSGESVIPSELNNWYEIIGERIQLVNCYGPTETTIIKSYYFIKMEDVYKIRIPIGNPISGSEIIILDKNMKPVDINIPGEIYIRTPYASKGYYNDRSQTKEKFINNPFSPEISDFMYKTGDLGRLNNDSMLEFLGRSDSQVKIRGFRIELGEIENHLLKFDEINQAVVIDREDDSKQKYLSAYLVKNKKQKNNNLCLDVLKIRTLLSKSLPDYMIPLYFIELDKIPLSRNGKVCRKSLPVPEIEAGEEYVAPRNEIEEKLVEILSEVLKLDKEKISINSNFFELGGHSLKVTILISKIHKVFNLKLQIKDIFNKQKIGDISKYINNLLLLGRNSQNIIANKKKVIL